MDFISLVAVLGAVSAMVVGLFLVLARLKELGQGFGPNSLKALGVVLFIPSLVILGVVTKFNTEALAALFGTVAGYVLSTSRPDDPSKRNEPGKKNEPAKKIG